MGHRTGIGQSWFLAFPHKVDRLAVAKCLWEHDLVGFEPPIQPVITALEANRRNFSTEFKSDLDDFISYFLDEGSEVQDSAFWRAIRQEALDPTSIDTCEIYSQENGYPVNKTIITEPDETMGRKIGRAHV